MGGRGSSSASGGKAGRTQGAAGQDGAPDAKREYAIGQRIPDWVVEKKLDGAEYLAYKSGDGAFVKRETEKAYLIANKTDFGEVSFWMPKSWMMSNEQVHASIEKARDAFDGGAMYNRYLRETAESSGVKLGAAKSTRALSEKLGKAGVTFKEKGAFIEDWKAGKFKPNGRYSGKTLKAGQSVQTAFGVGKVVSSANGTVVVDVGGRRRKFMQDMM